MARIFALLSKQGTAAAETALCENHYWRRRNRRDARNSAGDDVPKGARWTDCSKNEALVCPCGARGGR